MKNLVPSSKIWLILLSFSLMTSCNSQNKADSQKKEEINDKTQLPITEAAQIAQYVIDIFEDSKGNLWFGSITKGAAKFDGKELRYLTTEDGLNGNRAACFAEDKAGNLWIGTHSGIAKYDGQEFTKFTEEDGLCDNRVSNLMIDKTGTLWVGTWGGVCKFDGSSFVDFPLPNPYIELQSYSATMNWLSEIAEDSKGNIWFGRDGYGACLFDGNTFTHFTKIDGLASNHIRDIQEDSHGNIWFGSRVAEKDDSDPSKRHGAGGLNKYDGEKIMDFPNIEGLHDNDVFEIYRDSKDNMWISTNSSGVYKYDGKEFTNYKVNDYGDLSSKAVQSILEDSKGNIWLGCSGGLFRLNSSGMVNVTTKGPWN